MALRHSPPRVLQVLTHFYPQTYELEEMVAVAKTLQLFHKEVVLVFPDHDNLKSKVPGDIVSLFISQEANGAMHQILDFWVLVQAINQYSVDVVHIYGLQWAAWAAAHWMCKPVILTWRQDLTSQSWAHLMYLRGSTCLIGRSPEMTARLITGYTDHVPEIRRKVRFIPWGILFPSNRLTMSNPECRSQVLEGGPSPCRMAFIPGFDQSRQISVLEAVSGLGAGIMEILVEEGALDGELVRAYRSCIVLMPPGMLRGDFYIHVQGVIVGDSPKAPYVVAEAGAHGRPIVIDLQAMAQDMVIPSVTGWRVPFVKNRLQDCFIQYLNLSQDYLDNMAFWARSWVQKQFTYSNLCQSTLDLYEEIQNKGKNGLMRRI